MLRHGDKPKRCRAALGRSLYDVCVGTCRCGACDKSIDSLDDFGCCIVSYVEAHGRLLPNSPSWAICGNCTDVEFSESTPHAVKIAEDLIHKALRKLDGKQAPHPAQRR